jgi:hypothetical protein
MAKLKLELIALSNYADFSKDGKLSLSGIFDEIYSASFPSSMLRGFLVFTFANATKDKEIDLNIAIVDPQGETFTTLPVKANPGVKGKGNIIVELVNIPLKSRGEYIIIIKQEKEEIGGLKFTAREVPRPQSNMVN